jgi:hypothetical protein
MTPENFVYWLQGFMELGDPSGLDAVQVQTIRDHLELVMEKQTPVRTVAYSDTEYRTGLDTWPDRLFSRCRSAPHSHVLGSTRPQNTV